MPQPMNEENAGISERGARFAVALGASTRTRGGWYARCKLEAAALKRRLLRQMPQLTDYKQKRDFRRTPEPKGDARKRRPAERLQFVVQKHAARRLHYDLRLEHQGVLKSWAVPKGPSLDPRKRRLAVQTEDHPLEYANFEGIIPPREYGAGTVQVWDRGHWQPRGDAEQGLRDGKLEFLLHGDKLRGRWMLVRMPREAGRQVKDPHDNWLLIKARDREACQTDADRLLQTRSESVLSGRDIPAITRERDRAWSREAGELLVPRGGASDGRGLGSDPRGGGKRAEEALHAPGQLERVRGAKRTDPPERLTPQLATLVEQLPEGPGWFHEPKLDGYRLVCRRIGDEIRLCTRRGNDWTARFAPIAKALRALPCAQVILDGEVVVFDRRGLSDFQLLQNAIGRAQAPVILVAFDLLYLDGWDLRGAALRARKELLRLLLAAGPPALRYGDHLEGHGAAFFREACSAGLEGVVSKRAEDPYRGQRGASWLKRKCKRREELVIVGFTDPGGSRVGLGALLLATREEPGGALRYAGKVGTGFNEATLRALRERLERGVRRTPPLEGTRAHPETRKARWVEPELVAEVVFGSWTKDGLIRHATYRGLRADKSAREVVREAALPERAVGTAPGPLLEERPIATSPAPNGRRPAASDTVRVAGVQLTHPDKVLYPETGITKRELAQYYERVAEQVLPYVQFRPLTLLRCPDGHTAGCFYQKHANKTVPSRVPRVVVEAAEAPYIMIDGLPALISLVQLGVLELHVWGARADRLEQADLLVFDLDPAEGLPWRAVVDAGHLLRERLEELGLEAFARVSGGKGLHVVVPLVPGPPWDVVKPFCQAVALALVREHPTRFTAKLSKRRREGKIFIDYLRNARDATAIASYSARAKPGAPVALPVSWDELDPSAPAPPRFSLREVPELVRRRRDPWATFEGARRPLPAR